VTTSQRTRFLLHVRPHTTRCGHHLQRDCWVDVPALLQHLGWPRASCLQCSLSGSTAHILPRGAPPSHPPGDALSARGGRQDASIKEPVHLAFAVDLSQMSFFQRGTVKEITALVRSPPAPQPPPHPPPSRTDRTRLVPPPY